MFHYPRGEKVNIESISRKDSAALWLAGAVEGEGCMYAYWGVTGRKTPAFRVALAIANTHPAFIRKVTECLVALEVGFYITVASASSKKQSKRDIAQVVVEGQGRLKTLLQMLLPHLACKKAQAEVLLQALAYREHLALQFSGNNGKNCGGMDLTHDEILQKAVVEVARLKREHPSVLEFSRQAGKVFGS